MAVSNSTSSTPSRCYVEEADAGLRLLDAPLHLELLTEAVAAVRAAVPPGLPFRDPGWRQAYVAVLKTLTYRYWEAPALDPAQAAYIQKEPGSVPHRLKPSPAQSGDMPRALAAQRYRMWHPEWGAPKRGHANPATIRPARRLTIRRPST
jgi:hypothetical protein